MLAFFFFTATAPTEIYTLSLHDALPISSTIPARSRLPPSPPPCEVCTRRDRKSTRLNSSHPSISYAVFCLKKKKKDSKCVASIPIEQIPTRPVAGDPRPKTQHQPRS